MITALRIRGLGVIDRTAVELGPGLTVITGETGAGKTMVVTSLGLLAGGRADSGSVRIGCERADVEAEISVGTESPVFAMVEDAGGAIEDGVLLLSRTVGADGRSRAFAGGRTIPNAVLSQLADELVTVHGQSEQLLLRSPERRRIALDRYAGAGALVVDYQVAYRELRAAEAALAKATENDEGRAIRVAAWRSGLAEIAGVDPRPDEDQVLADEIARLGNAEALRLATSGAHEFLRSDDSQDAVGAIGAARRLLIAESADRALAELADRLGAIGAQVGDIADELSSILTDLEADPARLDALQQRLSTVRGLQRRYAPGGTLADVLDWASTARAGVVDQDDSTERIGELTDALARARKVAATTAVALSQMRKAAAVRFSAAVSDELIALAMPQAQLEVTVNQVVAPAGLELPDGRWVAYGAGGVDEIDFLLTPHRGAPARPIAKGASGGELSRVMLAIEVVFAGADPVPTFVFDEVDAGVGGSAAIEVGRRLARLSKSAQVLVVTHLAQVAAFADRQLLVAKSDDGSVVASGITTLNGDNRIRELARMLGGVADSTKAAEHAAELLELATLGSQASQPTSGRPKRGSR